MDWQPIITAPFEGDLELAVIERDGVHALVFPCRRTDDGWLEVKTKQKLPGISPTPWRPWRCSST